MTATDKAYCWSVRAVVVGVRGRHRFLSALQDSLAYSVVRMFAHGVDDVPHACFRCKVIDGLLQDKSGSPVVIQSIDMACLLPCRSVGPRAAIAVFHNEFKAVFGTIARLPCFETVR